MRWFVLLAFLIFASTPLALGETSEQPEAFDEAAHAARMAEVVEQLLGSAEPARQAAGLLISETMRAHALPERSLLLQEQQSLDRIHELIDTADTPLARALLAKLCETKSIQADCVGHGLDDAIVRYDNAELFARMHLTEHENTDRLRNVLVEAKALNERHVDYALLLLDAIEDHGGFTPEERFGTPFLYGMSLMPGLSALSNLCRSPSPEDPELDNACARNLQLMLLDGNSIITTAISSAIIAQRHTADGNPNAQQQHEQWSTEVSALTACVGPIGEQFWKTADSESVREFLEHWQQYGEASAHVMTADKAGAACGPLEPSPFRTSSIN